jgi:hypothetical protein
VFWLALLLAGLWIVPGVLISYLLAACGMNADVAFLFAVGLPLFGVITAAHLKRMFWACPRCGRPFHLGWFYGNPFARRCVHCGLPKWAPKQEPAQTDFESASTAT